VVAKDADENLSRQIAKRSWMESCPAAEWSAEIRRFGLGNGESAVLHFAIERDATAVLDDKRARFCATQLGIPVVGTLGLVVRARHVRELAGTLGNPPSRWGVTGVLRTMGTAMGQTCSRRRPSSGCDRPGNRIVAEHSAAASGFREKRRGPSGSSDLMPPSASWSAPPPPSNYRLRFPALAPHPEPRSLTRPSRTRGSLTSRKGKRWKPASWVQIVRMPCPRATRWGRRRLGNATS
jgi:hypothetical protein